MNTFHKYLSLLVGTAMLVGTIGITARHYSGSRHGGYYRGGRGWYGSSWYGRPYGYGWGLGLGYPGYYTRPSYAKDNTGMTYWMVYNQSMIPLRVKSDRDETIIAPGASKKLYRNSSFNIRVYSKGIVRAINTRQHAVALVTDEAGRPHFKL